MPFTGSTLSAETPRNTQTSTNRTGQTWDIYLPCDIQFISFVTDIRTAGDYQFLINGNIEATVNSVAAATDNVTFTLGTPVTLTAGTHTLKLERTDQASIPWYNRSAPRDPHPAGDGGFIIGWGPWVEPSAACVHGTINFKVEDSVRWTYLDPNDVTGSSFAQLTWDVTFGVAVNMIGACKSIRGSDTWNFDIDSVTQASLTKTNGTTITYRAWNFTPEPLTAGTHTFRIDPTGASQRTPFWNGPPDGTPVGDGSVTGWSNWAEATADQMDCALFYTLATTDGTVVLTDPMTGSGAMIAPVPSVATPAPAATASGAAIAPTVTATSGVAGVAATGSGEMPAPALVSGSSVLGVVVAVGSGEMLPPTVTAESPATVEAVVMTASGEMLPPEFQTSTSGEVLAVSMTASGEMLAPSLSTDSTVQAVVATATGVGLEPAVTAAATVTAVVGVASGTALPPSIASNLTVEAVTMTGFADMINLSISIGANVEAVAMTGSGQMFAVILIDLDAPPTEERTWYVALERRGWKPVREEREYLVATSRRTFKVE